MGKDLNIDYTTIDFETLVSELIAYLQRTDTFTDVDFTASNIRTLVEVVAYVGAINSYYINAAAGEVYVPTARLYKNLNKIAQLVDYSPRGWRAAVLDVVLNLETDYTFGFEGRTFDVPIYSYVESTETGEGGESIRFVNETDYSFRIRSFGTSLIDLTNVRYAGLPLSEVETFDQLEAALFTIPSGPRNPFTQLAPDITVEQTVWHQLESISDFDLDLGVEYSLQFESGDPAGISIALATPDIPEAEIFKFRHRSEDGRIEITQSSSFQRFYLGLTGLRNVDSTQVIREAPGDRLTRLSLVIDQGVPPFEALIDGEVYSWTAEDSPISSTTFDDGEFLAVTEDLNVLLKVSGPPNIDFVSQLVVTTQDPGVGEVAIATIPLDQIDTDGNIPIATFQEQWQHVPESVKLASLKQGQPQRTLIFEDGEVSATADDLDVIYNPGTDRYTVERARISADDLRVFVKAGAKVEEWRDARDVAVIDGDSQVFFTRVNQDQKIEFWFGDDTYGKDPSGQRINVIGIQTTGPDGNVRSNTIKDEVTVTGFAGRVFRANQIQHGVAQPSSVLVDSEGAQVDFTIKQGFGAIGGAAPEETSELRQNIIRSARTQETLVTVQDYVDFISREHGDLLADLEVVNYEEARRMELLTEEELEHHFFNTIFLITVPWRGTALLEYQKDLILRNLRTTYRVMLTPTHVIKDAVLVPVDVLVRYTRAPDLFRAKATIETEIHTNITEHFARANPAMQIGGVVTHSKLVNLALVDGVSTAEVMINADREDQFVGADYNVNILATDYTSDEQKESLKGQLLRELEARGLLKKYQPLFNVEEVVDEFTGATERRWTQSNNIYLSVFEFPVLGEVVLQEES